MVPDAAPLRRVRLRAGPASRNGQTAGTDCARRFGLGACQWPRMGAVGGCRTQEVR